MKFIVFNRNLNNTAKFLVDEIGQEFEGLCLEDAIALLKTKTKECFERNIASYDEDRVLNGESIWGCYKGVSCLFTKTAGGNGDLVFSTASNTTGVVDVTYQSVL